MPPDLPNDIYFGVDLILVGELKNQRLFTLFGTLGRLESDDVQPFLKAFVTGQFPTSRKFAAG